MYQVDNYRNFKRDMRRRYPPIDEILDSEYVYFPLHFEPEATLNGLEPHFTNQMYAVELLSKSVPAGVDVVVKEHPAAVGNRPSDWINTIVGFPRVKLAYPFEDAIEIIRNSLATATITGTSGLEAAIMGKPVISLGPSYRFNFVDHVRHTNDLLTLRKIIKEIYESKRSADYKRDGAALKMAIELTCFKLDEQIYAARSPSDAAVGIASGALVELLLNDRVGMSSQAVDAA
jgi:hypothetical protein